MVGNFGVEMTGRNVIDYYVDNIKLSMGNNSHFANFKASIQWRL